MSDQPSILDQLDQAAGQVPGSQPGQQQGSVPNGEAPGQAAPGQQPNQAPTDFQKRVEELEKNNEFLQKQYKEMQGAYTRQQQILKAAGGDPGPQQPQTPGQAIYSDFVQDLMRRGYSARDAQDVGAAFAGSMDKFANSYLGPLQGQLQQYQMQQQAPNAFGELARTNPWAAQQLQDQELYQTAQQILLSAGQSPTPELAQSALEMAYGRHQAQRAAAPAAVGPQPMSPALQFAGQTFGGTGYQFRQVQNTGPARPAYTPGQASLDAELKASMNPRNGK